MVEEIPQSPVNSVFLFPNPKDCYFLGICNTIQGDNTNAVSSFLTPCDIVLSLHV